MDTNTTRTHLERLLDGTQRSQLRVAALPIFRLSDMQICGKEMLIRVPPPFTNPEHLFRESIKAGLLVDVDQTCLHATITNADEQVVEPNHRIHLNIYQQTLLAVDTDMLISMVTCILRKSTICFELIESSIMLDPEELSRRVGLLQNAGIEIGIDDVGYGSSSLETLTRLEPEVIKLDRSCVSNAFGDIKRERRLARLVAAAHALGATVIAEGMDSENDLRLGRELGIAMGQGLLTGPLPI